MTKCATMPSCAERHCWPPTEMAKGHREPPTETVSTPPRSGATPPRGRGGVGHRLGARCGTKACGIEHDWHAGKYSNAEEQTTDICKPCGKGKYSSAQGAVADSQCYNCSPGKYSALVAQILVRMCISCDAGTYTVDDGLSDCTTCVTGKASIIESPVCVACLPGEKLVGTIGVVCSTHCTPAHLIKYLNTNNKNND